MIDDKKRIEEIRAIIKGNPDYYNTHLAFLLAQIEEQQKTIQRLLTLAQPNTCDDLDWLKTLSSANAEGEE